MVIVVLVCLGTVAWDIAVPSSLDARDMGAVRLPDELTLEGYRLVLNGAEYRKRYGLKIYACGLYLVRKSSDASSIILADEPMAVRMHFVFEVPRARMIDMMDKGFRNSTKGNIGPIAKNIQALYEQLPDRLYNGDIVDLVYVPARGIVCYVNNAYRGESPGLAFKQAVFGIWLGEQPIANYLKEGLLGK